MWRKLWKWKNKHKRKHCNKFRNKTCEKRISEVAKEIDITRNFEEHSQNKDGENWTHADLNTRKLLSKSTTSMIKFTAGLRTHGERAKKIDKKNDHAECLLWTKDESWEHVVLCDRGKKTRED